ncbi:MAG: hypothetical protein IPL46_09690 [Saprospiraceae bacterium]|nr:hypothetical protein [Saprospiraceae bacterium]
MQGKVYLGLKMIKGLTRQTGHILAGLREHYTCLQDMKQLIAQISPTRIDLLIEVGALRALDPNRYRLFFERLLQSGARRHLQIAIFEADPYLHKPDIPDDPRSLSRAHLRLLGFTIDSPFMLFDPLPQRTLKSALSNKIGAAVTILAYYILEKPVTTEHGAHMCFATWYDQDLSFFDSVHFPGVLTRYPLSGQGLYQVEGRIAFEHGYPLLIVQTCRPQQFISDLEVAS